MNLLNDLNASRIKTLDFCYEKQAHSLMTMTPGIRDENTKRAIRKWLQIFTKAPLEQKHARNCLALLMQEQIADEGQLSNLFTKPANFKLNLNDLLGEIDRELEEMFSEATLNQHFKPENPLLRDRDTLNELNVPVHVENAHLRSELDISRAKILEQEKLIQALESQMNFEEIFEPTGDHLKENNQISTEGILKHLMDLIAIYLSENRMIKPRDGTTGLVRLKLFESICTWMSPEESWFINQLRVFDVTFEQSLNNFMQQELTKSKSEVAASATKAFKTIHKKMRHKQKQRLALQKRKHDTQIGLIKLEIFSELRKVFVSLQKSQDPKMWRILEEMEAKYTDIADSVIKKLS